MALVGQAPYDALGAQATEQGPASTMESNPTNRTLGAYTGYYRELLSFLTAQLRCPHEAADLVQETFARAWKNWASLEDLAAVCMNSTYHTFYGFRRIEPVSPIFYLNIQ